MSTQLILALDVDDFKEAKIFIDSLYPDIKIFKVGLQLFTAAGREIVDYINKKGASVFLDLKFFDIPNTVANAVRQAVRLKVKMLTLHISGGKEMLEAAVKAAEDEALKQSINKPLLIGVTVLTSKYASQDEILELAKTGINSGLDGVVCSVREIEYLKANLKNKFVFVTPGIRSMSEPAGDQKRTATAKEALKAGSDFIVVGRPILKAKDPALAAREILQELLS